MHNNLDRYIGCTPGLWRAGRDKVDMDGYIYDQDNNMIGEVRGWGHLCIKHKKNERAAEKEQDANGRLLADAPALLQEVRERRKIMKDHGLFILYKKED